MRNKVIGIFAAAVVVCGAAWMGSAGAVAPVAGPVYHEPAYPTTSNTGVISGISRATNNVGYDFNAGGYHKVFNETIHGNLVVETGATVFLKNVLFDGTMCGTCPQAIEVQAGAHLYAEDVEITGSSGYVSQAIRSGPGVYNRLYIHDLAHGVDGIKLETDAMVMNSYFGPWTANQGMNDHSEPIQMEQGGATNMFVLGNTFNMPSATPDSLFVAGMGFDGDGPLYVFGNSFSGGPYSVSLLEDNFTYYLHNLEVSENQWAGGWVTSGNPSGGRFNATLTDLCMENNERSSGVPNWVPGQVTTGCQASGS